MLLPEIAAELLKRRDADQEARKCAERSKEHEDGLSIQTIDRDNTAWLKVVISEHGWPGITLVGEDGADAARLLAQHADQDLAFQKKALELLRLAVAAGQAPARHSAYLIDRVRVAEGKRQLYGTQYHGVGAGAALYAVEDPERLDERRDYVGLEPHADYDRRMRSTQAAEHGTGLPPERTAMTGDHLPIPPAEYVELIAQMTGYACLLVTDEHNNPLLLRASDSSNRWQWPGGNMEKGEDPLTTALREAEEETSLGHWDDATAHLLVAHFVSRHPLWPKPHAGWLFDGGQLTEKQIAAIRVDPNEHYEYAVRPLDAWREVLNQDDFEVLGLALEARHTGCVRYHVTDSI
ncbi:NUDIX hydrolase (plasmid) [Streptomyces sp. FXJ1.172]|uniref:DUF6624 domain-containing protein n=1 Tax=Streptomyces sp. FXJ1.172 TaxID=710705 RepID=UPI0023DD6247|nr:NUDIX hydrolase [Streptomyces sp. FXJ1.172]WEP00775.1 NUDIX hydrolase [Streptomyces sp. FXJ1.172]